jgi:glycosyltransferase involved in cell wall biosynthesis/2-polyprenyl-3-methyl-5-hydroxy-6-metoxy-1,4-benzoquinol methylase
MERKDDLIKVDADSLPTYHFGGNTTDGMAPWMDAQEAKPDSKPGRVGLGVGIITRGWSSIKWMLHMDRLKSSFPVGMFWKYIVVEGRGWADARTEVVAKARAMNFEWLLFIDDDVFIPDDTVNKLLQSGHKIITGMYWTKTDPPRPVIFKRMGEGPYDNFPVDQVIEIAGAGLGCCLIHMSVFDEFDKQNIPFFLENWIFTDSAGQKMKCPVGEDHYFFTKAKELGFNVMCDTGILCDHFDLKTKRFFPGEQIVRQLTEKKLKEVGREDLIDTNKKGLGLDPKKKTVVFFNATSTPFSGDELEKRPLGGSETAVLNISTLLANHFKLNVHVWSNCPEPGVYNGVIYHDIGTMQTSDIAILNPDLFVMVRNVNALQKFNWKTVAKKVVLWAHDLAGDESWKGFDFASLNIDKVVAVSNWHKENIKSLHKIPEGGITVLRNGVNTNFYKGSSKKVRGKCIYSSTPFRGLDILLEVWPEIKRQVNWAELYVFSSMKLYGPAYDDSRFVPLYEAARRLPGVHYFGSVKQDVLAKHFMEAELLTYPNTFDETSCITAMEAMTAGTPIVTSAKAGLNETVPLGCGILIEGNPYSPEYKKQFIEATVALLKDGDRWGKISGFCMTHDFSWETVAKQWVAEFLPDTEKVILVDKEKEVELYTQKLKNESDIEVNSPEYWDAVYTKDIKFKPDIARNDQERYEFNIKFIKEGDKVLDIGCGLGHWTRFIRFKYPRNEIWGTDFSLKAIDFCREKDRTIFYANHPYENTDNFEQNYFDVVTAEHILEHFEDPKELIIKMRKLVKKDGTVIIVIPINDEPWCEHPKIWFMPDVYELISKYFPKDEATVKHRYVPQLKYKDGRVFEEAIVVIKLGGI